MIRHNISRLFCTNFAQELLLAGGAIPLKYFYYLYFNKSNCFFVLIVTFIVFLSVSFTVLIISQSSIYFSKNFEQESLGKQGFALG